MQRSLYIRDEDADKLLQHEVAWEKFLQSEESRKYLGKWLGIRSVGDSWQLTQGYNSFSQAATATLDWEDGAHVGLVK